jgi:peptidoglycan/LPS O-acetylase OafA/YrhL
MQSLKSAVLAESPTANNRAGSTNDLAVGAEVGKAKRIDALDFTKGILVLIMVLYHWLNYFVTGHDWIYKYLRFLPISFVFISGFLISQVYLTKYKRADLKIPKRLLVRGLKLLALVAFLNLAPRMIGSSIFRMRISDWTYGEFARDYFTGTHPIAFSVLVPIAYLLILSAGLFFIATHWESVYHIFCLALVVGCAVGEARGINSGYLQTVSIGMLGVSVGHIPIEKINALLKYGSLIFLTYAAYLVGITLLTDSYLLQIVGVGVTLLVIYWCGTRIAEERTIGRIAILLGQYSLFSYIIQIVILQILRGSLQAFTASGVVISIAAFAACVAGTILSVMALKLARSRAPIVNTMYKAVFA